MIGPTLAPSARVWVFPRQGSEGVTVVTREFCMIWKEVVNLGRPWKRNCFMASDRRPWSAKREGGEPVTRRGNPFMGLTGGGALPPLFLCLISRLRGLDYTGTSDTVSVVIQTSRSKARKIKVDRLLSDPLAPGLRCERPVRVAIDGRPDAVMVSLSMERDTAVLTEVDAPCRKCAQCLEVRKNRWGARAAAETLSSHRTWFGTLTWRPECRTRISALARRRSLSRGWGVWEGIPSEHQFRFLWEMAGRDVTLWLKRVRKETGIRFRYCAVVEKHKDGFPHVHLLLHEQDGEIKKRTLDGHWRVGFSQFRLVPNGDVRPAFYVAKYLAKHSEARIRASGSYGRLCVGQMSGTRSNGKREIASERSERGRTTSLNEGSEANEVSEAKEGRSVAGRKGLKGRMSPEIGKERSDEEQHTVEGLCPLPLCSPGS